MTGWAQEMRAATTLAELRSTYYSSSQRWLRARVRAAAAQDVSPTHAAAADAANASAANASATNASATNATSPASVIIIIITPVSDHLLAGGSEIAVARVRSAGADSAICSCRPRRSCRVGGRGLGRRAAHVADRQQSRQHCHNSHMRALVRGYFRLHSRALLFRCPPAPARRHCRKSKALRSCGISRAGSRARATHVNLLLGRCSASHFFDSRQLHAWLSAARDARPGPLTILTAPAPPARAHASMPSARPSS